MGFKGVPEVFSPVIEGGGAGGDPSVFQGFKKVQRRSMEFQRLQNSFRGVL